MFSASGGGPLPETRLRGVTLDANGAARRSAPALDDELMPSSWTGVDGQAVAGALNDRIVEVGFVRQLQIPELFSPSDFVLASFVRPGTVPLATAAIGASTLGNVSGSLTNIDEFGLPRQVLLWDDRALVIGDDFNRTLVSLFWLR